jgi:hypothetical protein
MTVTAKSSPDAEKRPPIAASPGVTGWLAEHRVSFAIIGLLAVEIETGRTVEWLRFEHTIDELCDLAALPAVRQSQAIGSRGEALEAIAVATPA